jgi:hypothetical protein
MNLDMLEILWFYTSVVSQFNRSIANPMRIKAGDVEPQLEDFSDSSSTQMMLMMLLHYSIHYVIKLMIHQDMILINL